MANVILRPDWNLPERRVTPFNAWRNRRQFLRQLGLAGAAAWAGSPLSAAESPAKPTRATPPSPSLYPAARHPDFNPPWKLTDAKVAGSYNNFYEFSLDKEKVRSLTGRFMTSPWPVEIGGLVERPMKVEAEELVAMFGLEERVYRFRCVEAWSMIVPWTGFPLAKLIEKVGPKPAAKFIRFETFHRPAEAPGFTRLPQYPW